MKTPDNRIVIVDASPSGVSGDKYLGALLDLGGKPETVRKVARVVAENFPGTNRINITSRKVERGEIAAQLVTVDTAGKSSRTKAREVLRIARKCVSKLDLSEWATKFSISTIQTLTEAEAKVHGHSTEDVELEELGSPDTLVDVLGVAQLADSLELANATWFSSPIAVGGGTTRFSNRTYPNPPPAVAEILRGNNFPVERGMSDSELSTPTGAAITVNLVRKYVPHYPTYRPETVGYGAGSRELDGIANILRLTVGQRIGSSHSHDEIVILETNLDDVTGEVIARAAEQLLSSGARDVTIAPVYMKKNRPGHIISVISTRSNAEKLADVLMAETGTLGVREIPVLRHISPRKTTEIRVKVKGSNERVRVKLAQDRNGRVVGSKPEYEDLKRISERTGLSIRDIQRMAKRNLDSMQHQV